LLARDERERTVLHHCIFSGNVQILERIWKWANEQLTQEELKELVLAQNNYRRTSWNMAVQGGKSEAIVKLWEKA
jgi:hypothetical protein